MIDPTPRAAQRRPNILVLCMDQWDVHMDLPPGRGPARHPATAHRMAQKGAIPFQEASIVNLTVVCPTGPSGVRSNAVGSHLDLATTFLSWAGLDEAEIHERYRC